ncbi:MAG TPA: C40 family peptidase [Propionibacteriaceae bacterium]|nr:C40 family peptidase [Propionibacteriaceae bacterium]
MINVRKALATLVATVSLGSAFAIQQPAPASAVSVCQTATTRSMYCSTYFANAVSLTASKFGTYNSSNLSLTKSLWHAGSGVKPSKYFGNDVKTQLKNYQGSRNLYVNGVLSSTTLSALRKATPYKARPTLLVTPSQLVRADKAVAYAFAQIGDPYRYGATGPSSFDCSGLTMAAWKAGGEYIPRTASGQMSGLARISKTSLRPGDLVIFYNGGHASIYIGGGKVIHSPRTGSYVHIAAMSTMPFAAAVRVN